MKDKELRRCLWLVFGILVLVLGMFAYLDNQGVAVPTFNNGYHTGQ